MVKKVLAYIVFFVTISCGGMLSLFDDKLTLKKESFLSEEIKVGGYYYNKKKLERKTATDFQGNYKSDSIVIFDIYFFYKNGIIINIHSTDMGNFENKVLKHEIETTIKNKKPHWGVFQVQNSLIKIERWTAGEVSKTFVFKGKILNDTTFSITESYRPAKSRSKTLSKREEVYHFKKFNPKPDSTNNFIK